MKALWIICVSFTLFFSTMSWAQGYVDLDNDRYSTLWDCDDSNPEINPGVWEVWEDCRNNVDDDCDGKIDLDDPDCWKDSDGDGYSVRWDCNDLNPLYHPRADEDCEDEIDNDCDNRVDLEDPDCAEFLDTDGDGVLDPDDICPRGLTEPAHLEDHDGYMDNDGCQDPDNDDDGFWDEDDVCPDEAENHNGFEDEDGCADEVPIDLNLLVEAGIPASFEITADLGAFESTMTQQMEFGIDGWRIGKGRASDQVLLLTRSPADGEISLRLRRTVLDDEPTELAGAVLEAPGLLLEAGETYRLEFRYHCPADQKLTVYLLNEDGGLLSDASASQVHLRGKIEFTEWPHHRMLLTVSEDIHFNQVTLQIRWDEVKGDLHLDDFGLFRQPTE